MNPTVLPLVRHTFANFRDFPTSTTAIYTKPPTPKSGMERGTPKEGGNPRRCAPQDWSLCLLEAPSEIHSLERV